MNNSAVTFHFLLYVMDLITLALPISQIVVIDEIIYAYVYWSL